MFLKIPQVLTLSLLFSFAIFNHSAVVDAENANLQGNYNLRINLVDNASSAKQKDLLITNDSLLPSTNTESFYSQNLNSTGGLGTKTWSVVSGSFPSGLTLNKTTGEISGIAGSVGTYIFQVTVTDEKNKKAEKTFTLKVVAVTKSVTLEGDSRTVGYPAASVDLTFPAILKALLGPTWRVRNVATSGQTTDNMLADAAAQIDAFRNASLERDVVILWTGINDINDRHRDGQFIYNNIINFAKARKAHGFEVWVCTEIPGVFSSERESARTDFNRYIKTNFAPADKLVDLSALSAFSRKNNQIYYQPDQLHLTEAANKVLAQNFFTLLTQPH